MSAIGYRRLLPAWLAGAGTPAEGAAPPDGRFPRAPAWARDLVADRALWGVLLIWALCWLGWAIYLERFADALPWCDEYAFVLSGIATHEKPLTWEFLWTPANEHRAPLTRLWCVLLGRAYNWNFRYMLQVDMALLAVGCLAPVFAARAVRGRSSLGDAFLPLLVLTSAQFETLSCFVYAYAMALAVWCATAGAVMVKWQLRTVPRLLVYLFGALVVTCAGGPAGNLWALGLCVPLALGWFEPTGRLWKACAAVGGAAVAGCSALLLYKTPPPPAAHLAHHSDSWAMTARTAGKLSVGWMGNEILQFLWPWALLVLLVPLLYLLARFLRDVRRFRAAALVRWSDLAALLAVGLVVIVAMAEARANYPGGLWSSRYVALEVPIPVVVYLLLVRCAAPKTLLTSLAVGMAVCVGWNWPAPIAGAQGRRPRQLLLTEGLRGGHEPLCVLAEMYPDACGWSRANGLHSLILSWDWMRRARISVFARDAAPAEQCPLWHAREGTLAPSVQLVADPRAMYGIGALAAPPAPGLPPASAVYEFEVATSGTYRLCTRWKVPAEGQVYTVSVDGGPPMGQVLPLWADYTPAVIWPFQLTPGRHRLTVTWPGPGSSLDVIELVPL
jgi:hypothetical protein